ncbi:MAG: Re/Si-specific NAD(P)(+) transhydrogenase subunit alpha [Actinomycetia bacterium]|nr:Re/Si-specific NAD(P)(+) transhydrogenase subunit alpha [Actinomycetes bacterium]
MELGILKEPGYENRVAIMAEVVKALTALKVNVGVEKGAGERSMVSDSEYREAGASIAAREEIFKKSDMLIMINPFGQSELKLLSREKVIVAILNPFFNKELVAGLAENEITSFSMELIPRITRAQAMDTLSSMATIAGYKAVLDAAFHLPRFFPMFMSAVGTIKPAKVLILGAGVAGLQAIAISRKLGAVVEVFDVRAAVKEEVESLGGRFIEVEGVTVGKNTGGYAVDQTQDFKKRQGELIHRHSLAADVVICTAQIPGKKAPILIHKETVENMKAGSVIVDLAASTGGNCQITQNNEVIQYNKVTIIGKSNYPSDMPNVASNMFGKNILNFLKLIIDEEGNLELNFEDEIVKGTCLTHKGKIVNERVKSVI